MKILYLERNHGDSYSYYNEILSALSGQDSVEHVIKFSNWSLRDSTPLYLRQVLDKCSELVDIVIVGFGWTDCGEREPKPIIGIEESAIPIAVILNKEYAVLDKKLDWIKNMNPIVAFCVHHDYQEYSKITGVPFYQMPFAVNETIFRNHGQAYSHDFGFSGVVRPEQSNNWRSRILEESQKWSDIQFYFTAHQHDSLTAYAQRINATKIWLSTTGPADLVGTRYYEVMACNTTLLACNRHEKVYAGLFEEDRHCVMFDTLQELQDKIHFYINNEAERRAMVQRAHEHVLKNHTWNKRGAEMVAVLTEKIGEAKR
jgi:hypothetical protein